MNNILHTLKKLLRSFLLNIGLYETALSFKSYLSPEKRKYRNVKTFKTTINGINTEFSTEDEYSNSWFYPRYAGGQIHERSVTEMLIKSLDGSKCFVDIGTNLGWYTCLACTHMPNGTIYGFEMDDLTFSLLKKNIAINNCNNVEVHNMAVSDSAGEVSYEREINRPNPSFSMNTSATDKSSGRFVSINSIALDDFLESKELNPDVVKIDVEGAEMLVLKGMIQTIKQFKPTLFLEIHPQNILNFKTSTSEIISFLLENNYNVFEIDDMRSHESNTQLNQLDQQSVLETNTMLYAIVKD